MVEGARMKPTLTIVTPTIGRASLATMLAGLVPQLDAGDEVLVIGDGPQPEARRIVEVCGSPLVKYSEHPQTWNYGNPQRNHAATIAAGDYLMFVDDDDRARDDAVRVVRAAARAYPGRPLMFRMIHSGNTVIWRSRVLVCGNVGGQIFVVPNAPGRVGRWSGKYAADFDFIRSTLALYPDGENALVWRDEIINDQGNAGPGAVKGAVELP